MIEDIAQMRPDLTLRFNITEKLEKDLGALYSQPGQLQYFSKLHVSRQDPVYLCLLHLPALLL
jgi:hypothetical protein